MKITFFETTESERAALSELLKNFDISFYSEKLSPETANLAKDSEVISVFINSEVKQPVIDLLPNLKMIQTRSTGFDHIDADYAKSKNVVVSTVPAYGSRTVAEFTFALLLALVRKIYDARHRLEEGSNFDITGLEGFELKGKTLGVIGTGRIGKNVISIARGFEMNVLAYDLYPDTAFASEKGIKYAELEEVLNNSDIVTLHTPYNKQSYHLLNAERIAQMKKGAYLINTARGELMDTDALIQALESGQIGGAGLDVLESERQLKEEAILLKEGAKANDYRTLYENHVLMDMKNVVLTPHIAFYTKEGVLEILETTAKDITSFAEGKPINII